MLQLQEVNSPETMKRYNQNWIVCYDTATPSIAKKSIDEITLTLVTLQTEKWMNNIVVHFVPLSNCYS